MYLTTWDEFEKAAQNIYLKDPSRARYTMKYLHSKNLLCIKMTDDVVKILVAESGAIPTAHSQQILNPPLGQLKFRRPSPKDCQSSKKGWIFIQNDLNNCVQYKTEIAQDLRKVEKFINNLMRHMTSKP
ncbi:Signal recognition particle protein [Homalodisca vitripennis]|nr:Signal recognition particle protein [Homalodisca vitripennis]